MILCLVDGDPVSLEALTFARELGDVEALIFEETDVDGYTARARRVVHPRLGDYAPEAWAQAIVELEPDVVVAPGTDRGHEVLAHVAARLGVPLAANVVAVAADGDALQLTRQRWGGSLLE
jgi:electron transfer flavoprotein alpha subunit